MKGAHLRGARLEWASLDGAHLQAAFLFGAHLEGADLAGADLRGARGLSWEQLETATGWDRAKLPADLAERLSQAPSSTSSTSSEPTPEASTDEDPD
jgi:uncharacterized protein YjbI with pentapeptide repeats